MSRLHTACAVVAALFLASSMFGQTVALRLLLLAAGIMLASAVVAKEKDVRALPPVWIPFALWSAWALLSLTWSFDRAFSLKEWRNEVFYAGAGLWICYVAAQARHAVPIFGAVMAAAAVAVCGVALVEFSRGFMEYQKGWHGGPGDHSSVLLVLMPCAAMCAWYSRRAGWPWIASAFAWALMALFFASGYTTLNRTLWLSFGVVFAVLGGLLLIRGSMSTRAKLFTSAAVVMAALAIAAVMAQVQVQREANYGAKPLTQDHRLVLWPDIFERIGEAPLIGYGFGRGILREPLQQKFGKFDDNFWHAHNLFLEALLQLGAVGLALLVLLLAVIARTGWRAARAAPDSTAACGMALLGVLAGMLARNMTDSLLIRQNALLFWGTVGVLIAFCARPWRA